jgi:hypothetical protein
MRKDTAEVRLAALKALRSSHDQTMRTQGIHILQGPSDNAMTETKRWLEEEIRRLEELIHMQLMDAITSD